MSVVNIIAGNCWFISGCIWAMTGFKCIESNAMRPVVAFGISMSCFMLSGLYVLVVMQ